MKGQDEALLRFGRALAAAQDAARVDRHTHMRARFLLAAAGSRRPSRARTWWYWPLAGVAAAALAIFVVARWPAPALTFTIDGNTAGVAQAWLVAPDDASMRLAFSDGTEVALAPRSQARVTELGAQGGRVVLDQGAADLEVRPRPGAAWVVEAGPYRVAVVGTAFSVHWDADREAFAIAMRHGRVEVSGPGLAHTRVLEAGQSLAVERGVDASALELAATRTPSPPAVPVAATPERPNVPEEEAEPVLPTATRPMRRTAAADDWRSAARAGRWHAAIAAAKAAGLADLQARLSGADLLVLADAARFAREPRLAEDALTAARRRFPGSDTAAVAAFDLGRLHAADCARARTWWTIYLRERPGGRLADAARGRLKECDDAGTP